jgi:hypothetical protein
MSAKMKYLNFMAGFIGAAKLDVQLKRYTVKWSTKGIRGQDGYNWAKRAARSNYARGIPAEGRTTSKTP